MSGPVERRWESINYAKQIDANNKYGFTIVFNGTDENVETHKRFLEFSEKYDGVFITTLRVLLDSHDTRVKNDGIYYLLFDLMDRLSVLESRESGESKDKKLKTFGGEE